MTLRINGWRVMTHPALTAQILKLIEATLKAQARGTLRSDPNAKLLAALSRLMFTDIPSDPGAAKYRQGKTFGDKRKHWFRAKFGRNRFRLFYRYSTAHQTIVFAWVNDSQTLRTYGAKKDAYAVFKSMIDSGNPPDDWEALMLACAQSGVADPAGIAEQIRKALSPEE